MTRTLIAFILGLGIGAFGVMSVLHPHYTVAPWEICSDDPQPTAPATSIYPQGRPTNE
jgi:hypothetical protein